MTDINASLWFIERTDHLDYLRTCLPAPTERAATDPGVVIASLLAAKLITARHVQAALQWRDDWMIFAGDISTPAKHAASQAAYGRLRTVKTRTWICADPLDWMIEMVVRDCSEDEMAAEFHERWTPVEATKLVRGRILMSLRSVLAAYAPPVVRAAVTRSRSKPARTVGAPAAAAPGGRLIGAAHPSALPWPSGMPFKHGAAVRPPDFGAALPRPVTIAAVRKQR